MWMSSALQVTDAYLSTSIQLSDQINKFFTGVHQLRKDNICIEILFLFHSLWYQKS